MKTTSHFPITGVMQLLPVVLLLGLPLAVTAAPGDLDAAFGTGGKTTTAVGTNFDWAYAVAVQLDGKIIAGGFTSDAVTNSLLVRYTTAGALDPAFGGTGKVVTSLTASGSESVRALAIQPDGRIIAAGSANISGNMDFAVHRYNSDGTLDTSFNGTGIATTPIGGGSEICTCVALQPDGKIVMAGYASNGANNDFALVRFTAAGALDATFGTGGKVTTPIGTGIDEINAVALQGDGKIVAAGRAIIGSNYDFAVARYDSNGALDTTFNGTGIVTTPIGPGYDYAQAVAVQNDGKIVAAGYGWGGSVTVFMLARYQSNGALDTSFDTDGTVMTAIDTVSNAAYAIALQPGGKILVAGSAYISTADFAFARYNADGALDTSFSGDGKQTVPVGTGVDTAYAMDVQPDGKIVAAGASTISGTDDIAVVRVHGDAAADTDGDGLTDSWEHFVWGDIAGHSALDDSDLDGYTELLERALGLHPLFADAGGQPPVALEGGYLTMTLGKQPGASYEAQSAGTLLTGQPDSFSAASTTVLINNATTLKVRDNFLTTAAQRFMRLKVTAAP